MGFIQNYWLDATLVIVAIAALGLLWKLGKQAIVKRLVLQVIYRIDAAYDAAPDERFMAIYKRLPRVIRALCTLQDIRRAIDAVLKDIEKALEEKHQG